jgi:hypothetical protein
MHAIEDFFSMSGTETLIYFNSDDGQQSIPFPWKSLQILADNLSKKNLLIDFSRNLHETLKASGQKKVGKKI